MFEGKDTNKLHIQDLLKKDFIVLTPTWILVQASLFH